MYSEAPSTDMIELLDDPDVPYCDWNPAAANPVGERTTVFFRVIFYDNKEQYDETKVAPVSSYSVPDLHTEEDLDYLRDHTIVRSNIPNEEDQRYLVQLTDLPSFIRAHEDFEDSETEENEESETEVEDSVEDLWLSICSSGHLRDVGIMHSLYQLAKTDARPQFTELNEICKNAFKGQEHPHQQAFEKPMCRWFMREDEEIQSRVFLEIHLLLDVYTKLHYDGKVIMDLHDRDIREDSYENYGSLSEVIQVKGAITLKMIEVNGMTVNMQRFQKLHNQLKNKLDTAVKQIQLDPETKGIFNEKLLNREVTIPEPSFNFTPKKGQSLEQLYESTRTGYKPSLKMKELTKVLEIVKQRIFEKHGISIEIPLTKTGMVSVSRKHWDEYTDLEPFLKNWMQMEHSAHNLNFLSHLKPKVHPQYLNFVRNGRTSCVGPALQQTPRTGGMREIFEASPSHLYVTVDYSFIELCTLAAICEHRYGYSQLAEVIKGGRDPHAFTAAMIHNIPFEEFLTWKQSEDETKKKQFKEWRQQAKAVNFGLPSGLSSRGLKEYASSTYGAEMTQEETTLFRSKFVTEVYPELGKYLKSHEMNSLARALGVKESVCWAKMLYPIVKKEDETEEDYKQRRNEEREKSLGGVRNVLRGKTQKADGSEYSPNFVKRVWSNLKSLCSNQVQMNHIVAAEKANGSELFFRRIMGKNIATLTGRVRGKVGFTQYLNTPFSGLASDGGKLALWNLFEAGYRCVAFIHDEVIVEIPSDEDITEHVNTIEEIMCESMKLVTGTLPIKCESCVSHVWSKDAEMVRKEDGTVGIWEYDPQSVA